MEYTTFANNFRSRLFPKPLKSWSAQITAIFYISTVPPSAADLLKATRPTGNTTQSSLHRF
ncbi:MAG: hypothetical protein BGN88_10165 [Clostridiales bacterium 43-6]|nr:MAG: hypothetical protein BGN88_10165 [Clostridiales bacterium 43-6]